MAHFTTFLHQTFPEQAQNILILCHYVKHVCNCTALLQCLRHRECFKCVLTASRFIILQLKWYILVFLLNWSETRNSRFKLRSFLLPSKWHGDNFLHTFTWHRVFPCLLFCTDYFSLVLAFPGLRIEALSLSTVQGKCLYKISKFLTWRTRKLNIRSYVLNLIQMNIRFHLSKVCSPEADLSAIHAQHVLLFRSIYWPSIAQQSN